MSREDDKRVAELLGYTKIEPHHNGVIETLSGVYKGDRKGIPFFTTDPSSDYLVLEWVRNHHDFDFRDNYADGLKGTKLTQYEPGMYSRALLQLDEKGLLK